VREGSSRFLQSLYDTATRAKRRASVEASGHGLRARLVLRDNLRHRNAIEKAYRQALGDAKQDVTLANAYFLPGGKLRRALVQAASRGVRVNLLLQGRYEYFMAWHASRPIYQELLAAGVNIVAYEASFLHAKVAVVDAQLPSAWATVGSSNLDPLSLLMAKEANVVVHGPSFASQLKAALDTAMAQEGKPLALADFAVQSRWQRFLDRLAYTLMRSALWVLGERY
jgi:cardiolipin synthase A/B